MSIEVKRITPNDPEFANIAAQITPIQRVKQYSQRNTYLDAEPSRSKMAKKRRHEDTTKLRG